MLHSPYFINYEVIFQNNKAHLPCATQVISSESGIQLQLVDKELHEVLFICLFVSLYTRYPHGTKHIYFFGEFSAQMSKVNSIFEITWVSIIVDLSTFKTIHSYPLLSTCCSITGSVLDK